MEKNEGLGAMAVEVEEARAERSEASASSRMPDPEVVAVAKRRSFTREYKLRIVEEADRCKQVGEVGMLLRREGLHSSQLTGAGASCGGRRPARRPGASGAASLWPSIPLSFARIPSGRRIEALLASAVWGSVTPEPFPLTSSRPLFSHHDWPDSSPSRVARRPFPPSGGNLGIRSIKTAVRAPRMNCYAERLIGTIRRELFDHVIVSSEGHARRLLRKFQVWYNENRPHLALEKDAPDHGPVEPPEMGEVVALPRLGGLHHRYARRAA